MVEQTEKYIDLYSAKIGKGKIITPELIANELLQANERFTLFEIGWVIKHVFGIFMQEAMHIATVERDKNKTVD